MGQFSWIHSDTDRQMVDNKSHESYLLVPPEFVGEFGSHHIKEDCYDGYGMMGGYDVYDLVAYWNKEWIVENPDYKTHIGVALNTYDWYPYIQKAQNINNFEDFREFIKSESGIELRLIGIDIACYDEDNESLENPIKIVEGDNLTYNQAYASKTDPNQGWETDDEDMVYLEDVTAIIGEWLSKDTSDLPYEVVSLLEKVYNLCGQEL